MKTIPLRSRRNSRDAAPLRTISLVLLLTLFLAGCKSEQDAADRPLSDTAAANSSATVRAEDITFAQITDAHLFDAGKRRHGPGIFEEALDNRAALHWAILEINRIEAGGRHIDFVVFTGDWGLENVKVSAPTAEQRGLKMPQCPAASPSDEGPVPAVDVKAAAKEVADEFRALVVNKVFLVPGNNDVCNEDPRDLYRYVEFVADVQQELPGRVIDLTHLQLNAGHTAVTAKPIPDVVRGFSLLGLNSASFKTKDNLKNVKDTEPGHPHYEMQQLEATVKQPGSYLIFTHIPDLKDPAAQPAKPAPGSAATTSAAPPTTGGNAKPAASPSSPPVPQSSTDAKKSAWALEEKGQDIQAWERIAKKSNVLGIFAGHFHSSDRNIYGYASEKSSLAVRPDVAGKTWVAPPLAIKFQFEKPEKIGATDNPLTRTARGFLLATVTSSGAATATVNWYVTLDQKTATDQDTTLAEAAAEATEGHWDKAAGKYLEAMKSSDSRVRATAAVGYVRSRAFMRKWWWQVGTYFPPLRWIAIYPRRAFWTLVVALVLLVSARPTGKGLIYGLGWILKKALMPRFKGRATILVPTKLTTDTNSDLFASEISCGSSEVKGVLQWFGVSTFAGSLTLLAIPSEMTNQIIQAFPADVVKGVNITKILEFLLAVGRYFTWRVESRLAFCPDPPTPPPAGTGTSGPAGEMRAFATLRWGWFTKGSWCLEQRAKDAFDLRRTAFALAARILGEALRLRR